MSEETQNTAVEEAVKEPQVSQDEKKTQEAVPYYRFQELVKERNELKSKVDQIATAQEEQRKKTLEEQGEYKALLVEEQNKNKDLQTKFNEVNESFNNYVNQERESLLSKIPETKREKFEKVDDLSLLRDIASEFDSKSGVNVGQVENKVSVQKFKGNPFSDMSDAKQRRGSHKDLISHYLKKK
jgi:seryl-tRNA synthetase